MKDRMEPKLNYITVKRMGWLLRHWQSNGLTEARIVKMQRLWLGSDFTAYMDEEGRIAVRYFNEVRRILKYRSVQELMDDIRRTLSFYIIGTPETGIKYIVSNLWNMFDKERMGDLLPGSSKAYTKTLLEEKSASRKLLAKCDAYSKDNISKINFPTGGTLDGVALSEPGEEGRLFDEVDEEFANEQNKRKAARRPNAQEQNKVQRDQREGRRVVREYLEWVQQQTDQDHQEWVKDCMIRICEPMNDKGQVMESQRLNDEQGNEVLGILLREVLPYELAKRDKFFDASYVSHPGRRIYWLRNLTRHYGRYYFYQARLHWDRRRKKQQAQKLKDERNQERQNRPISPHEWQDEEGQRWYLLRGFRSSIPPAAPPRPSEQYTWDRIHHEWRTKAPEIATTTLNNNPISSHGNTRHLAE